MYLKKKRDCKGSISPIIKFIEWTLLDTFTQVREKERKKEKEEKGLLREIFVWRFPVGLILPVF